MKSVIIVCVYMVSMLTTLHWTTKKRIFLFFFSTPSIFICFDHIHPPSFNHFQMQLPSLFIQLYILFLKKSFKANSCCSNILGSVVFRWNLVNLPGLHSQRILFLPLPAAKIASIPQLGVGLRAQLLVHTGVGFS